jgi:hypothetical protein
MQMNERKPLEGLLILTPTAKGLAFQTEVSLDRLCSAGAEKIRSTGNSCVAMHRCSIAGKALDWMTKEPTRFDSIFWLDGDMEAPLSWVVELRMLVRLIAKARPAPRPGEPEYEQAKDWTADELAAWRDRMAPALSGAYVKRNTPTKLAARHAVPETPAMRLTLDQKGPLSKSDLELPAVVAGMGCLMQTAGAFLAHCCESPQIELAGRHFPGITASMPAKSTDGTMAWSSEDWTYTSWEWQQGRRVYLVRHAIFGHLCEEVRYPDGDSLLE